MTLQIVLIVIVATFCAFFAALWVHKTGQQRRDARLQAHMDCWGNYIVRCHHFQTHGCSLEFPCDVCEHYNESLAHQAENLKEKTDGQAR